MVGSPLAPGRGKKGADGSGRLDGGGRRSWRGGAPRTWQQVHAGGDGGEGARGGKDETSEAFPANGACCAAGGGTRRCPSPGRGGRCGGGERVAAGAVLQAAEVSAHYSPAAPR